MKITHLALLAVLAVSAQSAFAQSRDSRSSSSSSMDSRSSSGSSGGSATGASAAGDSGDINNIGSAAAGVGVGEGTDVVPLDGGDGSAIAPAQGEIANTGGEPLLMALAGFALASGGLLLRRKIA